MEGRSDHLDQLFLQSLCPIYIQFSRVGTLSTIKSWVPSCHEKRIPSMKKESGTWKDLKCVVVVVVCCLSMLSSLLSSIPILELWLHAFRVLHVLVASPKSWALTSVLASCNIESVNKVSEQYANSACLRFLFEMAGVSTMIGRISGIIHTLSEKATSVSQV